MKAARVVLSLVLGLCVPEAGRPASTCYSQNCSAACASSWTGLTSIVEAADYPDDNALPVAFVDPDDGLRHRFVVTQSGKIWEWDADSGALSPFLDLTARVSFDGDSERGLLAMAVDPDYRETGELYVFYTGEGDAPGNNGDLVVERYHRLTSSSADPTSAETILVEPHSLADNHNGGSLAFGPDGMLYVSTGDGGGGCDSIAGGPHGQSTESLLGKLLRIDVRGVDPEATPPECATGDYTIPFGNPFAGAAPDCGEIWAYGLRNPFRFSFDRATGDLWLGDVGQNSWEEVNYIPASYFPMTPEAAINFGWRCREGCQGRTCRDRDADPDDDDLPDCGGLAEGITTCGYPIDADPGAGERLLWDPVLCHDNRGAGASDWQAVIGGYRYRGNRVPALSGRYLYGDPFCLEVWRSAPSVPEDPADLTASCWFDTQGQVYSFAEDSRGELYLVLADGRIQCIHPEGGSCPWAFEATLFDDGFEGGDTAEWTLTLNSP